MRFHQSTRFLPSPASLTCLPSPPSAAAEITDSETGELVLGTRVVRIDRAEPTGGGKRGDGSEDGWIVQTVTDDGSGGEGARTAVLAKSVINSAGLKCVFLARDHRMPARLTAATLNSAHHILNQVLPESERLQLHFAKGSYFSCACRRACVQCSALADLLLLC